MQFSEWKEKENLKDDMATDTVEFNFKNTFIFDEQMTLPLTGDEIITMPHIAMMVCTEMWLLFKSSWNTFVLVYFSEKITLIKRTITRTLHAYVLSFKK